MKSMVSKIVIVLLITLTAFSLGVSTIYANPVDGFNPNLNTKAAETVTNISQNVLGIIQVAGTAIAIGMLLFLGIKYVKAAPDEKANIKQSSVIYIIGAIILFAAVNIVKIIYDFSQEAIK